MKHYKFPAAAFIGYIRICRPGSILGPQQQFLCKEEERYFLKGDEHRSRNGLDDSLCLKLDKMKLNDNNGNNENRKIYSKKD